ncbi:MAG: ABC transporter permease [Terriglobia bacterium]|jgi:putative ABC transport system permease protein|nr:ABC transporter permease [Terriglobia bacterium]
MALPITYTLRNIRERWKTTLLAIGGIALVVAVFVSLAAMASGFRIALAATGSDDNGIVVQRGSASELTSWMNRSNANTIIMDSRVARGPDGQPLAACDIVVITGKPRRSDGEMTNITVRGVQQVAFQVRRGIQIVEGRNFQPGLNEIIVGKKAADRIRGFDLGSNVWMQKRNWKIVGIFTAGDSSFESEIWGDFNVMNTAFDRNGGCESLTVRLTNKDVLSQFDKDLRANPQMQVQMDSERKYYADQAGPVATALLALAGFVAIVMGIGAVFGAMNTMYGIVAARTREVGTLRALGFSRLSILFSFLIESVMIAILGGVLGCLLAIPMNGFTGATGNTAAFAELSFAFRVTPTILVAGVVFSAVMGLVGGLLPALRAARLPITIALREA